MEKKPNASSVNFKAWAKLKDTQHQPENGYENATDEEKTKMMLQIAKEANAEQKAMFETEKLPQADMIADDIFGNPTEWYCKNKVIALLKEEQPCLCKDKGVIELIEEAVEVERKRIQEGIEWLPKYPLHGEQAVMLSEAIQVINKEEIPRNPLNQNKWM